MNYTPTTIDESNNLIVDLLDVNLLVANTKYHSSHTKSSCIYSDKCYVTRQVTKEKHSTICFKLTLREKRNDTLLHDLWPIKVPGGQEPHVQ